MRKVIGLLVGLACAAPGLARAQVNAAEVHHAPFTMPDLVNGGWAGADVFIARFDDDVDNVTALTLEPYAVARVSGDVFVWGTFPIAMAFGEGDSVTGWGNLTGGGYFATRRGNGWFGGGASLSLPTASDDGEDATVAAFYGAIANLDDIGRYLPEVTTVRVHGDARGESGNLFVQSQLRIERLMDDGDDVTFLFIGLAGGAGISDTTAVMFEINIMSDALDDQALSEEVFHLGLRTSGGPAALGFRLSYADFEGATMYGAGVDSRVSF